MMQDALQDLAEGKRLLSSDDAGGRPEKRFAILGSFTLDYLPPFLACAAARCGFLARVRLAGFNQWRQEILDPSSGLYAFEPDVVVLYAAVEDVFLDLYQGPAPRERQEERVRAELEGMASLIERVTSALPKASVHLVIPPILRLPGEAVAGAREPARGQRALESYLSGLRGLSGGRVVAVDFDWHARFHGAGNLTDDRLWYMARMRLGMEATRTLAGLIGYYLELGALPRAKAAVVDLDNTLWGGVAGEDGWERLELGPEGVGLAFQEFQRELARLRDAGVLLAICSKNDEATAWEVFDKNRGMALKREDFSAWRINWLDKSENLRSLAAELGLGVESFVFLDDDPVQRAGVRAQVPALVPDLPADPAARPRFLRELRAFHRLALTEEDAVRSKLYRERAEREALKSSSKTLSDFLSSLRQEALIERLKPATLQRAAQLCQKTNQFNLTTRRYGEAELSSMLAAPGLRAYTLSLRDSFGDNGIVGLAILRLSGETAEIDTLLMSCRVLGRTVEHAFASFLARAAAASGARSLLGRHIPTAKNGQTRDFYAEAGFSREGEPGLFRLDLSAIPPPPPGVSVKDKEGAPFPSGGTS
ncbi:MAG: HAD-IIIC family phosphatase [Elusimicrobia bacterium]|nr:HAD-IIIC family phosphatase [Elusimicrobiota bacterium]